MKKNGKRQGTNRPDRLLELMRGRTWSWLSRETDINVQRLLRIRQRGLPLTLDEADRIAKALDKTIYDLFQEQDSKAVASGHE